MITLIPFEIAMCQLELLHSDKEVTISSVSLRGWLLLFSLWDVQLKIKCPFISQALFPRFNTQGPLNELLMIDKTFFTEDAYMLSLLIVFSCFGSYSFLFVIGLLNKMYIYYWPQVLRKPNYLSLLLRKLITEKCLELKRCCCQSVSSIRSWKCAGTHPAFVIKYLN